MTWVMEETQKTDAPSGKFQKKSIQYPSEDIKLTIVFFFWTRKGYPENPNPLSNFRCVLFT